MNENYYNATEEAKEVVIYGYSICNIQLVVFLKFHFLLACLTRNIVVVLIVLNFC